MVVSIGESGRRFFRTCALTRSATEVCILKELAWQKAGHLQGQGMDAAKACGSGALAKNKEPVA